MSAQAEARHIHICILDEILWWYHGGYEFKSQSEASRTVWKMSTQERDEDLFWCNYSKYSKKAKKKWNILEVKLVTLGYWLDMGDIVTPDSTENQLVNMAIGWIVAINVTIFLEL